MLPDFILKTKNASIFGQLFFSYLGFTLGPICRNFWNFCNCIYNVISYMWNELNCFSKIISSSFFCDNLLKYLSGSYIIFWSHWNSHKSFIISQIQINLATIVQNVNLETILDKSPKRPFVNWGAYKKVAVSMLPNADFSPNDHQDDALRFSFGRFLPRHVRKGWKFQHRYWDKDQFLLQ